MTKIDDFISDLDSVISRADIDVRNIYGLLVKRAVALQAQAASGGSSSGITQSQVQAAVEAALAAASLAVNIDNTSLEITNDAGSPIPVNYPELLTRLGTNGAEPSHVGSEAAQLRQLADYLLGVNTKLPAAIGSQIPVTLKELLYSYATATNATATVTLAAPGQGLKNVVKELHFSTSGGVLGAAGVALSITANGNTYSLDITNNGPGSLFLSLGGASNGSVVVTLAAGGSGVVGKLLVGYQVV